MTNHAVIWLPWTRITDPYAYQITEKTYPYQRHVPVNVPYIETPPGVPGLWRGWRYKCGFFGYSGGLALQLSDWAHLAFPDILNIHIKYGNNLFRIFLSCHGVHKLDQVGRPWPYYIYGPDIYQHSCQGSKLNSQNWSILWPWRGEGQNDDVYVANLHFSLDRLVSALEKIGWVVSEEKRTQTTTHQTSKFTKSKYIGTLTCSHGGVKVKMKYMLQIYIVPSVDWYHHWRNRSSSFGGEANTN